MTYFLPLTVFFGLIGATLFPPAVRAIVEWMVPL